MCWYTELLPVTLVSLWLPFNEVTPWIYLPQKIYYYARKCLKSLCHVWVAVLKVNLVIAFGWALTQPLPSRTIASALLLWMRAVGKVFLSRILARTLCSTSYMYIWTLKGQQIWVSYSIFVKTCARILLSPNISQTVHVYSCTVYSWSSSLGCLFFLKLANVCILSEDPHQRLLSQPNVQLYSLCTHVQCTCLK